MKIISLEFLVVFNLDPNNYGQDASESPNVIFVPPPLHAAVAHGSVNAASCLLRMGADPSIRPIVPTPYLSRNYQPSPTNTRGGKTRRSSMEEDRNYKKYHEMSAWELAFGSIVVLEDGDVDGITNGEMEVDEEEEEEEVFEKRGWFGFGGGHKKEEEDQDEDVTIQQQHDANGKQRIVRRRQPLNIAPNKLEGIRHAFTAEALRAIGADEVDRLKQLLDSGMDSDMEVAGKSLVSWAIEMEADGCCELLRVDEINANDKASPPDSDESSPVTKSSNEVDQTQPSTKPLAASADQPPIPSIHDERLAGLSPKDILTLIQENENLIPALTTCRDDLAEETSACQNILRDVQASGGRGGLSSQSLLDLVHSLKEKRRDLEEGVKNWQHAWEEREDELDFFWEEVLNDEWREHLAQSGILDNVTDTATMMAGYESTASLDDLTRRFCDVDNRVNTLRSSIASLADECARCQAEVERAGMSGALSLTKSLREELKEMESQLSEAKSGEAMCRRKIELIQERLTNSARDESMGENVPDNGHVDAEERRYEGDNSWQGQEGVSNLTQDFAKKEMLEGTAYAEAYVHRGMERECNVLDQYEGDDRSASNEESASSHESYYDDDKSIENNFVVDEDEEHSDFVVVNDTDEVTDDADETILAENQEEAEVVNDDDNDETLVDEDQEEAEVVYDDYDDVKIPSEVQEQIDPVIDAGHMDNGQSHKIEINEMENGCEEHADSQGVTNALVRPTESEVDALKPSDALKSGMSTAIVVRQPTGHSGSFSLQIWDLIRRIVGLGGRTPTPSYHTQSESSANIMIV